MNITITDVHKRYGDVEALAGPSMEIPSGSTFGILGTNGAGKTTLFRLLVGHDKPDAGSITVGELDVEMAGHRVRERIGFLPEHTGFPGALTGREVLSIHARIHGIEAVSNRHDTTDGNGLSDDGDLSDGAEGPLPDLTMAPDRIDDVLERVGLVDAGDRTVSGYSNGMGRRLGLAAALLAEPPVLVLDEPTAGLDPRGVATFHDIIERLDRETDTTVVLSSHVLSEVERLCDEVVILDEGRTVAAGPVETLRTASTDRVTVSLSPTEDRQALFDTVLAWGADSATDATIESGSNPGARAFTEYRSDDGGVIESECTHEDALDLVSSLDSTLVDRFEVTAPGLEAAFHDALDAGSTATSSTDGAETDGENSVESDDAADGIDDSHRTVVTDETGRSDIADESQTATTDGGYEPAALSLPSSDRWVELRQAIAVSLTEYRLAVRSSWAVALVGIFAAFTLGLTTFSGASVGPDGFDRTVASLGVLAIYLVPLVALAFSYDAIVGREEDGWLQALFALPMSRAGIVVGTVLGRAAVLASATVIGFGIAGGFLLLEFGFGGFDVYVAFVLATVALGLVFLALGVLLSTLAREKTHALGASLLVWAWFVLVHDLLALGVIAAFSLPDAVLSVLLLANPATVFRTLVLGALGAGGDAGFAAVLSQVGLSSGLLVGALLVWIVFPITLAAVCIRRRTV